MQVSGRRLLGIFLLLSASAGCRTTPIPSEEYDALQRAHTSLMRAREEYVVQPGDQFKVTIFRGGEVATEYSQQVVVQPDDKLTLVNIPSPIETKGHSVLEVKSRIEQAYFSFFQDQRGEAAKITIQFVASEKANWLPDQVYVAGQVRRAASIPYRRGLTALQAVAEAGGWVPTADESRVVLLRFTSEGSSVTRELDLSAVVGHSGDDIELFPGDVVYVPLSLIAKINIWVEFYIRNMLPINPTSVVRLASGA